MMQLTGFDPRRLIANMKALPAFVADLRRYSQMNPPATFKARLRDIFPILHDRHASAGDMKGQYFQQDLWAARKVFLRRPDLHVDIGSRIDGFVAHLLTFMPVTLVDIRPIDSSLCGLSFIQDDATRLLHFADDSVDSISSLHAAEHFGLGRYSDPVDPTAYLSFMNALSRVLQPGGRLYFSVPVGRERLEFNAHRVFSIATILNIFDRLKLVSFSLIGDDYRLEENIDPFHTPALEFGCGLFEFTK